MTLSIKNGRYVSSSYIGETCHHFETRIEEHIKNDNKSHIFKHIHSTAACFDSFNFNLKIKEVLHLNSRKPNLNP